MYVADINKIKRSRNAKLLEDAIVKATRNPGLVAGLVHFFSTWKEDTEKTEPAIASFMDWARTVSISVLRSTIDNDIS